MTLSLEQTEEKAMNGGVVLAVVLAKHSSGALSLCDGREICGCDRLRRCYCGPSTISESITQGKKISPIHLAFMKDDSIWPIP